MLSYLRLQPHGRCQQGFTETLQIPSWVGAIHSKAAMHKSSHQASLHTLGRGISFPGSPRLKRTVTIPQSQGSPFAGHGARVYLAAEVLAYPRNSTHQVVVRARSETPSRSTDSPGSKDQSRSLPCTAPWQEGIFWKNPATSRHVRPNGTIDNQ